MPVQTEKDYRTDPSSDPQVAPRAMECRALISGLNHDLAAEYQAVLMYTHYSAKLTGPYRRELRALFQEEIGDELRHAQFLADKVIALGGEPATQLDAIPHADDTREMLEQALKAEKQAIADYDVRLHQAEAFGDIGLKVALENLVADETRHKEELECILAGWNEQNRERVRNEDRWQDNGGQG
jgi:bacterioferritin